MKVGLVDVDGHNFPNLALMKLSSFHKAQGDVVEWCNHFNRYDIVYKSKVFTFTPDDTTCIQANKIIKGGTGYRLYYRLFCDGYDPDYTIYPMYKAAYGFITRGCIRTCPWCIVPTKEGLVRPDRDIESILQGRNKVILMDNNVLASDFGVSQLEKIIDLKCKADFNQGLDCRLVTDEIAQMLSKIKWIRFIRFSCDCKENIPSLVKAVELLNKYGVKNYRIWVYVLVHNVADANYRCNILKKLGLIPFAQVFRDYEDQTGPTELQKSFARYVNRKEIFMSTTWENYNQSIRLCV